MERDNVELNGYSNYMRSSKLYKPIYEITVYSSICITHGSPVVTLGILCLTNDWLQISNQLSHVRNLSYHNHRISAHIMTSFFFLFFFAIEMSFVKIIKSYSTWKNISLHIWIFVFNVIQFYFQLLWIFDLNNKKSFHDFHNHLRFHK